MLQFFLGVVAVFMGWEGNRKNGTEHSGISVTGFQGRMLLLSPSRQFNSSEETQKY